METFLLIVQTRKWRLKAIKGVLLGSPMSPGVRPGLGPSTVCGLLVDQV